MGIIEINVSLKTNKWEGGGEERKYDGKKKNIYCEEKNAKADYREKDEEKGRRRRRRGKGG